MRNRKLLILSVMAGLTVLPRGRLAGDSGFPAESALLRIQPVSCTSGQICDTIIHPILTVP
jgi:hypothetical protein